MNLPHGLEIRALESSDSLEELTEFFHRAYAHLLARGLLYTAAVQDVSTTRSRIEGGECFIGMREGRIVASVTFHDARTTSGAPWYDREDVACFHQLCVDPDLRGNGVARALMDIIERRARETGARELACDTAKPATDLVAMYQHWGYRIVGEVSWGPTNYESVILSKTIAPKTRTAS